MSLTWFSFVQVATEALLRPAAGYYLVTLKNTQNVVTTKNASKKIQEIQFYRPTLVALRTWMENSYT